ncbi:MAG: hypothetical protein JWM25_1103, partial [Thermoleophilia bacterium]|nr:hypothetical protein [Thermoleophilia bacterium]
MRAVAEPRRWSHHDDGFALVELIVAVLLLTVAIGGAIAVASSSSRSATASSIRQSQTAILASAAEKVRSDSSWTSDAPLTCASVGARSDITSWLQSRIGRELATDAIRGTKFVISATATAVDSAADDLCPIDADGIVPDYYDIEVVARPDAATLQRNPRVGSITERFQVNFSNRTSGGRLSIQACYSWPQVDERIPTGSCDDVDGGGSIILPPATAPVGTGGTPTCTSGDDCTAWTCAHPMLQAKCDSGAFGDSLFVSLQPIAASGWTYTVRGTDANTEDEPVRTGRLEDDGTTTLDAM